MARRVLVVEDDDFIRDVIAIALEDEDYEVDVAACASEVWDYLARATPDLILLDLALPEEDGLSICRKLRGMAQTARVPIVFVSAMGEAMYIQAASRAGGNAFIRKPFEIEDLVAKVDRFAGAGAEVIAPAAPKHSGLVLPP